MTLSVLDAGSFLHHNCRLDSRRIQSVVYFAQCAHVALLGTPLFDAKFEHWVLGPVDRCLWSAIKYNHLTEAQPLGKESALLLDQCD